MIDRKRMMAWLMTAACGLAGCGQRQSAGEPSDVSRPHFILFGRGVNGLVAKVKQPTLTVCLSGSSAADEQKWRDNIKSTVLKWIRPMRSWTSERLAESVEVDSARQSGCDFSVRIASGTWANTSIGSRPVVRMNDTGYFASYNVLLHELGHAFALSDTYRGASGDCQPGQPQAVMCNTSFNDLQADDVAGLQSVFKDTFPGDRPPSGGVPVNPANPTQLPYRIFVAVGSGDGTGDLHRLHASLADAATDPGQGTMEYCEGDLARCSQAASTWTAMTSDGSTQGVRLWKTAGGIGLRDSLRLTVRYRTAQGQVTQGIQIRQK